MMLPNRPVVALALLGALWGCDSRPTATGDVLATAENHSLTVDEAAQMILTQDQLPAQSEVVLALTDLWTDYMLLALAASEDPELGSIDLEPLVDQRRQQELVYRLREEVITVDTAMTTEELQAAYERDLPGAQIRASHILLNYPEQATPEQRDSVLAMATDLRDRALAGESFGDLAREYSSDAGTASQGGDLGFFGRGQMVKPFEDVAFATPLGEISEPVETPFGLHVIRVEDRQLMPFDSVADAYRQQLQARMIGTAESTYVASVREPAQITVAEDGYEITREIARNPGTPLRGRAASRGVVTYEGGAVTARDIQLFVQGQSPAVRGQVVGAGDEQLENLLTSLAQGQLLAARATELGVEVSPEEVDSVATSIRTSLQEAAEALGLMGIEPAEGETPSTAVDRAVGDALMGILRGELDVVPLGPISFFLRDQYGSSLNEEAVPEVVSLVQQGKTAATAAPSGPMPAPDSSGGASQPQ
jgi:parvulin-like peptidyl-prolyl isomerase